MLTDQKDKQLEQKQIYQWAAFKALVIDQGKVLLGKRLDSHDYGLYELPGGKLEVGEDFVESTKREVVEETGVEVEPINLQAGKGYPLAIAQTGRQNNIVLLFVLAKVLNKEKIQSENEELSEINFYSKDQVREFLNQRLIRPVMVELLERFVKGEFDG